MIEEIVFEYKTYRVRIKANKDNLIMNLTSKVDKDVFYNELYSPNYSMKKIIKEVIIAIDRNDKVKRCYNELFAREKKSIRTKSTNAE